ncbi:APHP domain-containing protein [Methanothermococcus sp. SCGC AD-155-M21]|nr:APHP domain-containing protein [Methanothermococcus sp. SCGC AD-155-M21]
MKWKFLLMPILLMSLIGICYGENITVELLPGNIEANIGDTLNLSLVVKNVPEDGKCGGFDAKIYYDSNILNLSNIQLSDIGGSADLKNATINPTYGFISLMWFSNLPYGNITIATISFKALNPGEANIALRDTAVVNGSSIGYSYKNVSTYPATVVIKPNLNITNLSMGTPLYRINTPINVTITNNGHADTNRSFSVDLYADSNKVGSITLDGLNVGESKTLTFNWTPERVKPYTLVVVVDSENMIPEEKEDDNRVVRNVEVIEEPIHIKISPSASTTDLDSTFTVNISLCDVDHRRPVKGVEGVLTYDPQVLTCTNFTFLLNATENLENITFENGKVIFKIMGGEINESGPMAKATFEAISIGTSEVKLEGTNVSDKEGHLFNNVTLNQTTITVKGPNLNITNLSMGTPLYRINTPINVTITNNGHADTNRSFSVDLYADSNKVGSITLDGLNVGENKTLTFSWTPERVKPYTVVVVVDPENVVCEEKEDDNGVVKNVEVNPITTYLKLYKISQDNNTIRAGINISNIPGERPVGGYDIYIKLKNLSVINVNSIGNNNWSLSNNTLFITGFNFSKSGEFTLANITFNVTNVTNTTYSAILYKDKVFLSDTDGYSFQKVILENEIVGTIKNIKISPEIKNFINTMNLRIVGDINITILDIGNLNDTLEVPIPNESMVINITNETIENINKTLEAAEEIKDMEIENLSDVNNTVKKIADNINPILASNFNITNVTKGEPKKVNDKVLSTISFEAKNTSKKGFAIVRIPIGNMNIENITIDNGTNIIILKENDFTNKIGWYRILTNGVLEITVIKDPEINVTLSAKLPDSPNGDSGSSGPDDDSSGPGGRSSILRDPYPDVASGIKSEKIKEIVHKSKIIVGSEIDGNLSAKGLKTTLDSTDKLLEIKEDCILVGGPKANPIVKKYLWTFSVKVTNEYPGKHRGVIQKQIINGHAVILLAGSDRWGTKAAVEYFKTLEDIPDEPIFVEWRDGKAVKINKP